MKGENCYLGAQEEVGGRSSGVKNGRYVFASRTRSLEKGFQVLQTVLKTFVSFVVVHFCSTVLESSVFLFCFLIFIKKSNVNSPGT